MEHMRRKKQQRNINSALKRYKTKIKCYILVNIRFKLTPSAIVLTNNDLNANMSATTNAYFIFHRIIKM